MTEVLAYAMLVVTLGIAAVTDWRDGKIYNRLTYPAIVVGLLFWLMAGLLDVGPGQGIAEAAFALAAGIIPYTVVLMLGGVGGGDMKLMGAVGALSASWQVVLATSIYGLILAAVWAVGIMVRRGLVKRTLSRMFEAAISLTYRARSESASSEASPRVPFGCAVALGGLLAGAEHLLHLQTPWAWLGP